jgi:HEAT repeat protein
LISLIIGYGLGYKIASDSEIIKNDSQQIEKLISSYQLLSSKALLTINEFDKRNKDFLSKLNQSSLLKNTQSILSKETQNNKQNTEIENHQCAKFIDVQNVEPLISDMQSQDFNTRRRSLIALSLLGSANVKQQINEIINNEKEDSSLRADLIKLTDWQGLSSDLINLLNKSTTADVKTAAIQSAQTSQFSENERQLVNDKLAQIFVNENDDSVRIGVLDYFANTSNNNIENIIASLPQKNITPEVQSRIDLLKTSLSNQTSN